MAKMCQSIALSPTPFVLRGEALRRDEEAAGAHGGFATVYHGFYGEAEVAIKDFRLHENTINVVKKVR
jgi:hypothetical protein